MQLAFCITDYFETGLFAHYLRNVVPLSKNWKGGNEMNRKTFYLDFCKWLLLGSLFSILTGCGSIVSREAKEEKGMTNQIVILCPKTFADVIGEIKPLFEEANPNYEIELDVYPIRPMLNDILKGKEGDIFLSTGDVELSHLYEKNLLRKETERGFAEASAVALAVPGNPLGIKEFRDMGSPKVKNISVPDPEFNSVGMAFVEAAKRSQIYRAIKDRLHFAAGPKSSTEYMEEGNADVSITYGKCYYGHAEKNALIEFIPTTLHKPIICKAVALNSCKRPEIAQKFAEFLLTPENQERFEAAHFKKIEP